MEGLPQPPEDPEQRNIIDKLAQFVARNGPEFEQMTKSKQKDNPRFKFLFGGEYYNYYQYKVSTEQQVLRQQKQKLVQQHQIIQEVITRQSIQSAPWQPQVQQQQQQVQEQIQQSQNNLIQQQQHLMKQQQENIETAIFQAKEQRIENTAKELEVDLSDFNKKLQPIIDSCTKDAISCQLLVFIQGGKQWMFTNAKTPKHCQLMSEYLLQRVTTKGAKFELKLHIIYLINDVLHHCIRKQAQDLQKALEKVAVPIFCSTHIGVDEEKQQKLSKLLNLWETNKYFEATVIDQLKHPVVSMSQYQAALITDHSQIVQQIQSSIQTQYQQLQKQHNDYVSLLVAQQPSVAPQPPSSGFGTPPPAIAPPTQNPPPNFMIQQPPPLQSGGPTVSDNQPQPIPPPNTQPQQTGSQPGQQFVAQSTQPPPPSQQFSEGSSSSSNLQGFGPVPFSQGQGTTSGSGQTRPPFNQPPPFPHQAPQRYDYQHGMNQPSQGPGFPPNLVHEYNHGRPLTGTAPPDFTKPPPLFGPPSASVPPPGTSVPPPGPGLPPPVTGVPPPGTGVPPGAPLAVAAHTFIIPSDPNDPSLMPKVPYYDLPAGLMAPLVKLEDTEYEPLDPDDIRLPPPQPPTERLLAAVEAFYAPPSHDRPRNGDGWEHNGLYEFFRAKQKYAKLKKDREEKNKRGGRSFKSKSRSRSRGRSRSRSRGRSRSRSKSHSRSRSRSPRSRSRSRSRSQSRSPRRRHRSYSRSRSRSRSPHSRSRSDSSSPPYLRTSRSRSRSKSPKPKRKRSRSRSRTPPAYYQQPFYTHYTKQSKLDESNKGHQLLTKMGWSGQGLGANEQGIVDPIKGGDIRSRNDQFKGVGIDINDPFESFRRSKSYSFIARMKARDEAREVTKKE